MDLSQLRLGTSSLKQACNVVSVQIIISSEWQSLFFTRGDSYETHSPGDTWSTILGRESVGCLVRKWPVTASVVVQRRSWVRSSESKSAFRQVLVCHGAGGFCTQKPSLKKRGVVFGVMAFVCLWVFCVAPKRILERDWSYGLHPEEVTPWMRDDRLWSEMAGLHKIWLKSLVFRRYPSCYD